jgi:hypothetical protein
MFQGKVKTEWLTKGALSPTSREVGRAVGSHHIYVIVINEELCFYSLYHRNKYCSKTVQWLFFLFCYTQFVGLI